MVRFRVVFALTACVFAVACSKTPTKEHFLELGNQYAAAGKDNEAIVEYRNAVKVDARYGEAHYRLAELYAKTNDPRNTLREFIVAADLLPNNAEAQMKAGEVLLLAGRFEDAKTRADKALAVDPKSVAALLLRGNATAGLKDLDGAVEQIAEAAKLNPASAAPESALGWLKMANGQRDQAETAFKRAVEIEPKSVAAQLALAQFYWGVGRAAEAEAPLKRAVDLEPGNTVAQRSLATFLVSHGRLNEAEAPLKMLASTSKTVKDWISLADYYLRNHRESEGQTLLKAIAGDPKGYAPATLLLAALDSSQQHPEAAFKKVGDVLAKDPHNADALMMNARLLMQGHKVDEALAQAVAGAEAAPQSAAAQYLLGQIRLTRNEPDEAEKAFTEAVKLNPRALAAQMQLTQLSLRHHAAEPATRQLAEGLVRQAPQNPNARLALVQAMMGRNDLAGADRELNALQKAFPNAAQVHTLQGGLHLLKNEGAPARREFDRALELDSNSLDALRGRIVIDLTEHNAAHARALIDARVQKSPKNPAVLMLAATTYASLGDAKRQEALLRQIIDADPSNLDAYTSLATLFYRQGRLDDARTEYMQVREKRPTDAGVGTMIGLILEAQHKPAEAQQAYEKVLAASPGAAVAANNLAGLYVEHNGNLDVALQLAQTARGRMTNAPQVSDTLGWVYYKKDLPALAIPAFEASIKLDPKNPLFKYHLGLAYQKSGETEKARQAFDAALKLRPNYPEAQQALRALTQG